MSKPDTGGVHLRPATSADHPALWAMLEPVFRAGDTYAIDPAISHEAALSWWCDGGHDAYLAEADGRPMGSYYICPNQQGGGAHVANCGFVTAPEAQGRGVARMMLAHALDTARARGFSAMQFNCVVSSNTRAVALWQANGFEIVGRLPGAFNHPVQGYIDAYVMYRTL
ncbi:GNAT family N-acetyltransferase [Roseinatronobacter alkalisoli]|uniref:GNAT family N-acetyltransferase n=1 Tax=Roseinatronobacter alkalisoli TaxID=3028235 RepID=A0ABT5T4J8_9RHOB|nr:GNAT family N-acetyltransferase [Roseinatronobacter sp. HJB301]MDD7970046.1 GNAT family N-acetyltransferase [Roseinatronobacter sp. HJB301]